METGIIVLGMHRGGTSLAASLLHAYGLYAGDEELLMKGTAGNPRGYWEYIPLVEFNDALLASVGAKWCIPPTDEGYEELERKSSEPRYRNGALRLIETMQEGGRPWFWKDPRLGVLLPFWKNIWNDVAYLIPLRHPLDIALSLQKRDTYPISASLLIWQRYMLAILEGTETARNRLFIEYERLVENPVEQCEHLHLFLNRFYKAEVSKRQIIENLVQTIVPELRHNNSNSLFLSVPQATEDQKALDDFLRGMVEKQIGDFSQTKFSIYSGWREHLVTLNVMLRLWSLLPANDKYKVLSQMPGIYKKQFGL